jgi:hypothetical protein
MATVERRAALQLAPKAPAPATTTEATSTCCLVCSVGVFSDGTANGGKSKNIFTSTSPTKIKALKIDCGIVERASNAEQAFPDCFYLAKCDRTRFEHVVHPNQE